MLLLVVELLVSLLLLQQKKQNKNNEVFIFERSKKVLAKVAITGGGRCNVTNSFNEISSLTTAYPRGHKLLKRLFNIFDYTSCYQWFEEHGDKLITQETIAYFLNLKMPKVSFNVW